MCEVIDKHLSMAVDQGNKIFVVLLVDVCLHKTNGMRKRHQHIEDKQSLRWFFLEKGFCCLIVLFVKTNSIYMHTLLVLCKKCGVLHWKIYLHLIGLKNWWLIIDIDDFQIINRDFTRQKRIKVFNLLLSALCVAFVVTVSVLTSIHVCNIICRYG